MKGHVVAAKDVADLTRANLKQLHELKDMLRELPAGDAQAETSLDAQRIRRCLAALVANQSDLLRQLEREMSAQIREASDLRDVLHRLRPSRASVG
jgi:hypothetical protein